MKKTILLSTMFLGSLVFAQKTPVLGGDKDAHGCIGSAGYTYSQIKKDCIRTFEEKIKLKEVASGGGYIAAVIFSKDKKKAEVFVKDVEGGSLILTRPGKAKAWKKDGYVLVPFKKSGYQLKKDNVVIYQ
ncbi:MULTISPECIES: hypothetical protein [Chryseobacterium]|uniref:Carboxypeptidase regulatory-like domain-containing protein n=1 Tax=Chryseobacterium rhizosphaerae TaxID=395937 RepID=A0AAE4C3D3_9FLAO|nr:MULTISPECIES: hypothetical protein [Chryseobacterium]MBL3549921.1 hypothetical protein [Chryseobacterium sp. KMC2]MDR6528451.1 hypothetical protein [Chryseobacterium rhizosphaerae]MDR6546407.1 hypothetical protein [Chryseobacterium rhizosphaerae]REC77068.1 hypothetical protein DRF57_06695 [Chryseobacterium rhizosphaerae]